MWSSYYFGLSFYLLGWIPPSQIKHAFSFQHDIPWDSSKQNSEEVEAWSPQDRGSSPGFSPAPSSYNPAPHSFAVNADKTASDFQIHSQIFLLSISSSVSKDRKL